MESERRPLIATYMTASRPFGVIYVGMTSNLYARGEQHRARETAGFTAKYGVPWKMELIERRNPQWLDLYPFVLGTAPDPRVKPENDESGVESFLQRLARGEIKEP